MLMLATVLYSKLTYSLCILALRNCGDLQPEVQTEPKQSHSILGHCVIMCDFWKLVLVCTMVYDMK